MDTLTFNEHFSALIILFNVTWSSITNGILYLNNLVMQNVVFRSNCPSVLIRIHFLVRFKVLWSAITLDDIESARIAVSTRVWSRSWGINIDVFNFTDPTNHWTSHNAIQLRRIFFVKNFNPGCDLFPLLILRKIRSIDGFHLNFRISLRGKRFDLKNSSHVVASHWWKIAVLYPFPCSMIIFIRLSRLLIVSKPASYTWRLVLLTWRCNRGSLCPE